MVVARVTKVAEAETGDANDDTYLVTYADLADARSPWPGHDAAKRPLTLTLGNGGSLGRTYDRDGNVVADMRSFSGIAGEAGGTAATYAYDAMDRLVRETAWPVPVRARTNTTTLATGPSASMALSPRRRWDVHPGIDLRLRLYRPAHASHRAPPAASPTTATATRRPRPSLPLSSGRWPTTRACA